jgi:exodeoxyribonuclease VII large subunit
MSPAGTTRSFSGASRKTASDASSRPEKLEAEGLFDPARKQALPRLARTIGVVTSDTGAALRDFISILQRREWTGRLIVIPARVQGQGAAAEIAAGITAANLHNLCNLLVVGRGGGSLEDLWPFNEEVVARAIANSSIPVISAVGHEIDFTLSDFAADFRAETPSAAAEWITSARQEFIERTEALRSRFNMGLDRLVERLVHRLSMARTSLRHQHPRNRLDQAALRLDDLQGRLGQSLLNSLKDNHQRLQLAENRFHSLRPEKQLGLFRESLRQLRLRLSSNSHQGTLKRGFAIIRDGSKVLSDAKAVQPGSSFAVEMRDGGFEATRKERN